MPQTTANFDDLQGKPIFDRGRELGVFVYYTANDQRWHIRWNGSEKGIPVTKLYYWMGQVTATQVSAIQTVRFDRWQDEAYSLSPAGDVLSFHGVVFSDEDGIDFSIQGDSINFAFLGYMTERRNPKKVKQPFNLDNHWQDNQMAPTDIYLGQNKINPTSNIFTVTLTTTPPPPPPTTLFWGNTYPSAIKIGNVGSEATDFVTLSQTPFGLALDAANGHLYWADGLPSINRINIDGSDNTPLATNFGFTPYGLALDLVNNNAYCADQNGGKIWRINLDDGTTTAVINGLKMPTSVALDTTNQQLYWSEYRANCIKRANLSGNNITTLVSDLSQPQSIALDLANNKLYWSAKTAVQSADLDGSNLNIDLIPLPQAAGNTTSRTLTLDSSNGLIYWTDQASNTIQQAHSDGSNLTTPFTNLESPAQIAVQST